MKVLLLASKILLVLCVPLLLVSSTLRWAVNSQPLYEYGFRQFDISTATKIPQSELSKVAAALTEYFDFKRDSSQVTVAIDGKPNQLFTERELIHLEDVRGLVRLDYVMQWLTLAYLGLAGIMLLVWRRRELLHSHLEGLFLGSAVSLGLIIVIVLASAVAADQLFLLFHLVGFSNDFWILDPNQHYLIRLFPRGFFYQSALFIFGAIAVEALALGAVCWLIRRRV